LNAIMTPELINSDAFVSYKLKFMQLYSSGKSILVHTSGAEGTGPPQGMENATKLIKDGQRIGVNGAEGYVEIL